MDRRQLLRGVGLGAAAGIAAAQDHLHHSHGGHPTVVAAASDCVGKGEICLAHCYESLSQGDKSLAACAKSVSELTAVCGALRSLAAQGAPSLAKLAAISLDVCQRCEAECRKHEKMHSECKDCADACATCAAECRKTANA